MRHLLVVAAVALSACSPGSFNGTVVSNNLAVKDVAFALLKDDNGKSAGLLIELSDQPNICEKATANRTAKSQTSLSVVLVNLADDRSSLAPDVADYTMAPFSLLLPKGHTGFGSFSKTDANCTESLQDKNTVIQSGIFKITSLNGTTGGAATGTYDITVGDQNDKITGSFNGTYCDISKVSNNPNCE